MNRWLIHLLGLAGYLVTVIPLGCGARGTPGSSGSTPVSQQATAQTPEHLNQAQTGVSWNTLPDLVAQNEGMYTAENLTVDQIVANGVSSACQQLLARAADIGSCNTNDLVQAVQASDAPLVEVFSLFNEPIHETLMAKPSVKTWSDLKGKTIIVGGPKDTTAYFVHLMTRANGLKDGDYTFQYAGSSAQRYAALKAGGVDAAMVLDPYDVQFEQTGYTKLDELVPKYLNSSNYGYATAAVNKTWARDHSGELARYIRAELNAVAWIYDPANKQALFHLASSKLNMDQATFDRLYQRDVVDHPFWSRTGQITDSGIQGVLTSLVDLGSLKEPAPPPSKFYDLTYLHLALAGTKH